MFKILILFLLVSCATDPNKEAFVMVENSRATLECESLSTLSYNIRPLTRVDDKEFKDKQLCLNHLSEAKTEREKARVSQIQSHAKSNPLSAKYVQTAIDGKIKRGMPFDLVILSWGKPDRTNESVGSYGVHKQLVYPGGQYVYVKNGVVDSWQNTK